MGRAAIAAFAGWLALAACTSAKRSASDDDDGGGGAPAAGGSTSAAAMSTGGGSASGGAGSGGGSTQDSLYPLEVGHVWTFQVIPVGSGSVCASGAHAAAVLATATVDGREAFEVTNWCTGVAGTDYLAKGPGEEIHFYYQGSWLRVIAEPIQVGSSWDYFNTSYTWQDAGSVTVAAGTFSDCWTAAQNVRYVAYQTYCRGVGMVRSYSQDLAGNGWDAELVSTSF